MAQKWMSCKFLTAADDKTWLNNFKFLQCMGKNQESKISIIASCCSVEVQVIKGRIVEIHSNNLKKKKHMVFMVKLFKINSS